MYSDERKTLPIKISPYARAVVVLYVRIAYNICILLSMNEDVFNDESSD